jgi:hypothetical protein
LLTKSEWDERSFNKHKHCNYSGSTMVNAIELELTTLNVQVPVRMETNTMPNLHNNFPIWSKCPPISSALKINIRRDKRRRVVTVYDNMIVRMLSKWHPIRVIT